MELLRRRNPAITSSLVTTVLWNDAHGTQRGENMFQLLLVAAPADRRAPEDEGEVPRVACFGEARRARNIARGEEENPKHAAVVAIRSLRGQSGRVGAILEHAQPRVPRRLAEDFIGLFHSTTFANLIGIIHDGAAGTGTPWEHDVDLPTAGPAHEVYAALESR